MKVRMWVVAGLLTATVIVVLLLGFYTGPKWFVGELQPIPDKITYGYIAVAPNLPLFVAADPNATPEGSWFQAKGLKDSEGKDIVELVRFDTTNLLMEALLAGRVDVISSSGGDVVFNAEIGAPGSLKVFMITAATASIPVDTLLVRPDSPIASLADLEGKTVGTFAGATFVSYLKVALRQFLDPERDITIQQLIPTLQLQALASGSVDALYTLEPFGTLAVQQGIGTVLARGLINEYIVDPFAGGFYCVSEAFRTDYPDATRRLREALEAAVADINASERTTEKAKRLLLVAHTPVNEQVAMASNLGVFWTLDAVYQNEVAIQEVADFYAQQGVIQESLDVSSILLPR